MLHITDRLTKSAIYLGEMPSGSLLLKDNAHYPWFLIVPVGELVEWIDLPFEIQQSMLTDINSLSKFLLNDPVLGVEKMNIATIGNIVSQFHLHIVGRHAKDPAWPDPVWGHSEKRDYEDGEVDGMVERLSKTVPDFKR